MNFSHIFLIIGIVCIMCAGQSGFADKPFDSATVYQVAAFSVFKAGDYSKMMKVGEMKNNGDFGVGGFEDLDGELSQIEGKVYQIRTDGTVQEPADDTGVCFGNTITFKPEYSFEIEESVQTTDLFNRLNNSFPDHNCMYAYRIDGIFPELSVRSIPAQDEPYPGLEAVIDNQTIFQLHNVSGTINGFWFPQWMDGVNYAGFHPHFITDARDAGGHVLDGTAQNVTISVQPIYQITLLLPEKEEN